MPAAQADNHRLVYINPDEDPLTFFRLMLGIQTTPYLGFTVTGPLGTRCVVKPPYAYFPKSSFSDDLASSVMLSLEIPD